MGFYPVAVILQDNTQITHITQNNTPHSKHSTQNYTSYKRYTTQNEYNANTKRIQCKYFHYNKNNYNYFTQIKKQVTKQ
jgi:hypothetical protein